MPDASLKITETRAMELSVANRFTPRAFPGLPGRHALVVAPRDGGDLLKNKKYFIGALAIFISRGANLGVNR